MRIWLSMMAIWVAAGLVLPPAALGAESSSKSSTSTELSFTLPTVGQSGCMVCHGDPNLVQIAGEETSTIYVEVQQLEDSAHSAALCTGCHADFAYTAPHANVQAGEDWRSVAKLSCKSCKDHQTQFAEYSAGVHSPAGTPGVADTATASAREAEGLPASVPLCGDCHGGHAIPSKEDTAAQAAYQVTGEEVCGGECHQERSDNYRDYYHGAAYQYGTLDAPACWDCHGTHEVLPADDRSSMVNERNLADTCGQDGCHVNVDEDFIEYASFVHGRDEVVTSNPVNAFFESVRSSIGAAVDRVTSLFGG